MGKRTIERTISITIMIAENKISIKRGGNYIEKSYPSDQRTYSNRENPSYKDRGNRYQKDNPEKMERE
jgi:hypothetical protein